MKKEKVTASLKKILTRNDRNRVRVQFEGPTLTKQSFKDECDVNNIMKKFEKTGLLTHTTKYQGKYADFTKVTDYQSALNTVIEANDAFDSLPSKLRARFANDPAEFLAFVENPNNREEAKKLGLLKPEEQDQEQSKIKNNERSRAEKDQDQKKEQKQEQEQ